MINSQPMIDSQRQLVLIRHSAVRRDPLVPSHRWRLSAEGLSRCRQLSDELRSYRLRNIVTSNERKAMQTGQTLAEELSIPWRAAENLHEHDRRNVPYHESKEAFEAAVAEFFARPDELVFGRETASQAEARFEGAVRQVLATHPLGNIGIVAHGTVITLFLCAHNPDLAPFPFWRNLDLPSYFEVDVPGFTLQH